MPVQGFQKGFGRIIAGIEVAAAERHQNCFAPFPERLKDGIVTEAQTIIRRDCVIFFGKSVYFISPFCRPLNKKRSACRDDCERFGDNQVPVIFKYFSPYLQ